MTLHAAWEDEPQEERLRHFADAQVRLDAARLQLHDNATGEAVDTSRLDIDNCRSAEVRRLP